MRQWLETGCFALGLLCPFLAFWIWYAFESAGGRYASLSRTTAERMGFENALADPAQTALLVLVPGVVAFVCSLLPSTPGARVRS